MIGEKEQRKTETAVDKEKMGQRARQHPLSEKESRGTHLRGSPSLNGSLSPVSANTRAGCALHPEYSLRPTSSHCHLGGKAGSQTRPGEPSDLTVSLSPGRRQTEDWLKTS